MKVKNVSARLYILSNGTPIVPGATVKDIPDELFAEVDGIKDLEVTKETKAETVQFTEVPSTVKELKAALDEMKVDYPSTADKAELQALYDANKAK
jgi:hypothetical protein